MADKKVIIITGANTGLGLALVRRFLTQFGDTATVYLTARDEARGQAAVQLLHAEGLQPAFHLLDVTSDESVHIFADYIRTTHGGVDILVSNAAARISPTMPQSQQVEMFINTNNHGTYRILKAFGELLNDGARLLIVASSFGALRHLNPMLHPKFDVSTLSLEGLEQVMDEYVHAVTHGTATAQGWSEWINTPSKIGQVASMKVFAREMHEEAEKRRLLINAVCPGLIDTEASRPWFPDMSGALSPDAAAEDVVWLATLPPEIRAPYGELVQYRRVLPFN